jgi:hypothetical protein
MTELSWEEVHVAAGVGAQRWIESCRTGIRDQLYTMGRKEEIEIMAAIAEAVVAKALNRKWQGSVVNTYKQPDIEPDIEVRWTARLDGKLIVRFNDFDHFRYVLVRGSLPRGGSLPKFMVVGWMWGYEAKCEKYLKEPERDCFMVPENDLHPISSLTTSAAYETF